MTEQTWKERFEKQFGFQFKAQANVVVQKNGVIKYERGESPLDNELLAFIEAAIATARAEGAQEERKKMMAEIDLTITQSKEHSCRFNDGESNCECYLEGLNRVKRQLGYEQNVSTYCRHVGDKNDFHPQFCRNCGEEFMYEALTTKEHYAS